MSMGETLVTVVGNAATRPELKMTATGAAVTRFRLAATERRYDRAGERWTDGHTNFYTVWAWRSLGENVAASVGVGEPLVVQGRLRVREREDRGQSYVSADIDAVTVGHDLSRGTSAFRRVVKSRQPSAERGADPATEPEPTEAKRSEPQQSGAEQAHPERAETPKGGAQPGEASQTDAAQLELAPF
ncbi:single-stranded DNA-binding protein [Streptomyces sp. RPT161]|uniref:single-stranded DNA-binding protein n=1 Tax=Streptomyces sp. RPT161 TaxID=3015993 RepID=UPI002FD2BA08